MTDPKMQNVSSTLIDIITIRSKHKITQCNTYDHVETRLTRCVVQAKNVPNASPTNWTYVLGRGT